MWCMECMFEYSTILTQCGLVTPYGDRDLGQHWLWQWLVAWRHQAITWTNVDLSSLKPSDFHLRTIWPEILSHQSLKYFSVKITHLKFYSNLPGANELNMMQYEISDSFAMPISLWSANLMTNLQIVMLICVFESQTLVSSTNRARRPGSISWDCYTRTILCCQATATAQMIR